MQASTVNRESQKMLAKLLAKENLTVRIGNYSTAFFDVKNRVLGLPMWNAETKQVSDLLIGHEVGHALYTPVNAMEAFKEALPNVPFDIANIVEDVRIERLIQANYPGLVYSFKEGYRHFIEKDFFKIKNTDLSKLGFADRLNIRAKIGSQIAVPMNAAEDAVYERCRTAETFEEVLDICKTIYEMIKGEKPNEKPEMPEKTDENSPVDPRNKESKTPSEDDADTDGGQGDNGTPSEKADGTSEDGTSEEDGAGGTDNKDDDNADTKDGNSARSKSSEMNNESETSKKLDSEENSSGSNESNYGDANDELTSKTMNSFDKQLEDMQENVADYIIANAPDVNEMMRRVIPVATIMSTRRGSPDYDTILNRSDVQDNWKTFKETTKKHISVLIKEFERRKAAFQYSRSQQSSTGTIDVNRLHSYKFEDQLFRSITKLADAKNHGMVFFIDYSGSMQGTISRVMDQTLQLVFFCKAVGIPFEVYGFTGPSAKAYVPDNHTTWGENISFENTHIFELMNSSMPRTAYELACREFKAQSYMRAACRYNAIAFSDNAYEVLDGTPLNQTIIVAHEIVKRFKARHNVQKMNTIFLTDGDGDGCRFVCNDRDSQYLKPLAVAKWKCSRQAPINGRAVMFTHGDKGIYAKLIENLKITCGTTVIGFFIANSRQDYKSNAINSLRYAVKANCNTLSWAAADAVFQSRKRDAHKEKCMTVLGGYHYDAYFIFESASNLNIDGDDDEFVNSPIYSSNNFSDAGSQNRLAKQFTKFTSEKKNSRVFLNKFAEIIS